MRRLALRIAGVALVAVLAACTLIRTMPDDPDRWHVDPRTAERTGKPNDVTARPAGAGGDLTVPAHAGAPGELMARIDAIAMATPRTTRLAGDDLGATYVTRSRIFGFPDYTSIRAVEVTGGASLWIWGRARYGHSDLGVNRARVEDWLDRLGPGIAE